MSGPSALAVSVANAARPPDFHVIAEGWHGGPELGTQLRLCPLEGAVFACGSNKAVILRGDRFVHDPALEAGLPGDRWIYQIVGKWPESAWLLYADPDTGNWSYAVYRWTKSRWVRVLDVPQGSVSLSIQLVPWKNGALVRISDADGQGNNLKARWVQLGATGVLPDLPLPLVTPATCSNPMQHIRLETAPDGDLIGLTSNCKGDRSYLARWRGGSGLPIIMELPLCPDGSHPAASSLTVDPVIAASGDCGALPSTAYVARLDGDTLRAVDISGEKGLAVGYARNSLGEFVLLEGGTPLLSELPPLRLLKRGSAGWEAVPLPLAKFAPASCPRPPAGPYDGTPNASEPSLIIPRGLWSVGADTWIAGYAARTDCRDGDAGVLLRSSPTGEVLHLQ